MEKIVMPGDLLWEEETRAPNTYIRGGKTYATVLGMLRNDRFVPLEMVYAAKPGDNAVGIVTDVRHSGYIVDMNLAQNGFISSKFSRVSFKQGDIIYGRVKFVDEVGNVDLTDAKRLPSGKIVNVPASKVPRIIGKRSSMLNVVRDGTGCSIFVGNNGYIWIGGKGNLQLALKTINFIIENAHTQGLTDAAVNYLNENGGSVSAPSREEPGERSEPPRQREAGGREPSYEDGGKGAPAEGSGEPGEGEGSPIAQEGAQHANDCCKEECKDCFQG